MIGIHVNRAIQFISDCTFEEELEIFDKRTGGKKTTMHGKICDCCKTKILSSLLLIFNIWGLLLAIRLLENIIMNMIAFSLTLAPLSFEFNWCPCIPVFHSIIRILAEEIYSTFEWLMWLYVYDQSEIDLQLNE